MAARTTTMTHQTMKAMSTITMEAMMRMTSSRSI